MKLYLDEGVHRSLADDLRSAGHDVYEVTKDETSRNKGVLDEEHALRAQNEDRVLITQDKDFGELWHREGIPDTGVLYAKNSAVQSPDYSQKIESALKEHGEALENGAFVTVSAQKVRVNERQQTVEQPLEQEPQATVEASPVEIEQPAPEAPTPVENLARAYAEANPDAEATPEELHDAAYFAHSVEDSERYPPLTDEMKDRVDERQTDERFDENYAKATGENKDENKEQLMQERMETYMQHQKQYSM